MFRLKIKIKFGAKWDIHKKKWYYNNNLSKDNISILKKNSLDKLYY